MMFWAPQDLDVNILFHSFRVSLSIIRVMLRILQPHRFNGGMPGENRGGERKTFGGKYKCSVILRVHVVAVM